MRTKARGGEEVVLPSMASHCFSPLLYWKEILYLLTARLLRSEQARERGSVNVASPFTEMRTSQPRNKSHLPPCSRAGLMPSIKTTLTIQDRAATWPLWGQRARFSPCTSTFWMHDFRPRLHLPEPQLSCL